jgi:hypothetical protein
MIDNTLQTFFTIIYSVTRCSFDPVVAALPASCFKLANNNTEQNAVNKNIRRIRKCEVCSILTESKNTAVPVEPVIPVPPVLCLKLLCSLAILSFSTAIRLYKVDLWQSVRIKTKAN